MAVDRRQLLIGLGAATAAGTLLPVTALAAPQAWECLWVKGPTLQDHFTWKLDHITKLLTGTPENGPMHELLQRTIDQAESAGISIKYSYVITYNDDGVALIDGVWWRVGNGPCRANIFWTPYSGREVWRSGNLVDAEGP